MARALIFDWFGTLAEWRDGSSNYGAVLRHFGYEPDEAVIEDYHRGYDGIDHLEHSASREAYLSWTRRRLSGLAADCGIPVDARDVVVAALLESDYSAPMMPFPEVLSVLGALRGHGYLIGVCSNWGWDLEPVLEVTGVRSFVDVAVSSARVGYRKPHPNIYLAVLNGLGVAASDSVFVGDSWDPDVVGPASLGMSAVHVCRDGKSAIHGLLERTYRISDLTQLMSLHPLVGSAVQRSD